MTPLNSSECIMINHDHLADNDFPQRCLIFIRFVSSSLQILIPSTIWPTISINQRTEYFYPRFRYTPRIPLANTYRHHQPP